MALKKTQDKVEDKVEVEELPQDSLLVAAKMQSKRLM
jgi:hypothetical protein